MFSSPSLLPLAPVLPVASIAFYLPTIELFAGLAVAAVALLTALHWRAPRPAQVRLRLLPTANAWGYSERAQLDESAGGL